MLNFAANISLMFNEVGFFDRFESARRAGFKAVEFMFPYDYPALEIQDRLGDNNLENVLFNLSPGDWKNGERGLAALPGREGEFRKSVEQALEYAQILKTPRLHIMAGVTNGLDHARCLETFQKNLTDAGSLFADAGVDMLIEPINNRDMPGYFLTQINDALAIIETLSLPNLKLQFDIYHRQIMRGDVIEGLKQAMPHIGHIQIAGAPGRHEPDTGELNYSAIFEYLIESGYSGWIGCEYRPKSDTISGLGWLQTLREKGMAQ